jgi:hypothetical protein
MGADVVTGLGSAGMWVAGFSLSRSLGTPYSLLVLYLLIGK